MEIPAALTALSTALGIVKTVRELDKEIDSASLKSQMAEIYGTLADVKMALTDARETVHEKDQKIRELEKTIEAMKSGEDCPLCQAGRLKVTAVQPHPLLDSVGIQEKTLQCDNPDCKHSEKRMHDPMNLTDKS